MFVCGRSRSSPAPLPPPLPACLPALITIINWHQILMNWCLSAEHNHQPTNSNPDPDRRNARTQLTVCATKCIKRRNKVSIKPASAAAAAASAQPTNERCVWWLVIVVAYIFLCHAQSSTSSSQPASQRGHRGHRGGGSSLSLPWWTRQ